MAKHLATEPGSGHWPLCDNIWDITGNSDFSPQLSHLDWESVRTLSKELTKRGFGRVHYTPRHSTETA